MTSGEVAIIKKIAKHFIFHKPLQLFLSHLPKSNILPNRTCISRVHGNDCEDSFYAWFLCKTVTLGMRFRYSYTP